MTTTTHDMTYIIGAYKIVTSINVKSQLVAHTFRLNSVGKNKGQYKLLEGYYFKDEFRRSAWVEKNIESFVNRTLEAYELQSAKANVRANFENPYQVGDVLYDSWGYDQTNVDFYLITEVNEKSVMMQSIGGTVVPGSEGHMCCNVKPDIENKLSEPVFKRVNFRMYDGKPTYYISARYGSIFTYDRGDSGVYKSWYA